MPIHTRRISFLLCVTFVVTFVIESSVVHARGPEQPMNVLIILADDLGAHDLGVEGSTFYETPNIDALANSGARFTRGYAACQVCSPSRASLLTGTSPLQHGVTDWIGAASGTQWNRNDRVLPSDYEHALRPEYTTLAELLQQNGYATFFAGKWHLGDEGSYPEDHGFEINRGGYSSGSPRGGYFSPYKNPKLTDGPPGESLPIRLANETTDFIDNNAGKPFFAMLSFYSVHGPIQTDQDHWQYYRDKAAKQGLAQSRFVFDRTLPVRTVQDHPIYAGVVAAMDDAVGRVTKYLDDNGLADNTLVLFTSDNGGVASGDAFATSNAPLRGGKGRQWEGGLRVPFHIRVPNRTNPGDVIDQPVSGIDILPTIADALDIPLDTEQTIEGISIVPALAGQSLPERPLFWHYPHYGNQGGEPSSVISEGDWKLIHYFEDERNELYNLGLDPSETNDVVSSHPDRADAMLTRLKQEMDRFHVNIPQADSRFDLAKKREMLRKAIDKRLPSLERNHANFLKPSYQPNATWWGSQPRPQP
jgi:arylsulfatase A-like enzyme